MVVAESVEFLQLKEHLISEGRYPYRNPFTALKEWFRLKGNGKTVIFKEIEERNEPPAGVTVESSTTIVIAKHLKGPVKRRSPSPPRVESKLIAKGENGICVSERSRKHFQLKCVATSLSDTAVEYMQLKYVPASVSVLCDDDVPVTLNAAMSSDSEAQTMVQIRNGNL
ncbi:hypothetical protein Y1Q_0023330 [Alligator mississippiensis]|uniref:Uncharacterized protein n=1 Tax=Alligator mississippiensis TaxID=8496 RepID=A0A151NQ39_ALLMI|nr:hypothetical protein Y1Q_0023330 [Alligator mississippiensis]